MKFIFLLFSISITIYPSELINFALTNTLAYDLINTASIKFKKIDPLVRPRRHYAYYAEILDQIGYIKKIILAIQSPFKTDFYKTFLRKKTKETISCDLVLLLKSLNKTLSEFAYFQETDKISKSITIYIQKYQIQPLIEKYLAHSGTQQMTFLERHIFFKHFAHNLTL